MVDILCFKLIPCCTYLNWESFDFSYLFLQVDLKRRTVIKRILTQGRQDMNQWVTSYLVEYSNNGNTFRPYTKRGRVKVGKHRIIVNIWRIRVHKQKRRLTERLAFVGIGNVSACCTNSRSIEAEEPLMY